ncbi:MAG: SDR family oxidoreductase [Methanomicrobia archaeon]|nr:SDR family oxidoreductase [Methanomicrobia archaeon]
MNTGLKSKVVLITGASGGIGHATARAFAEEEAKLILQGRSNMKIIKQLQKELPVESLEVRADLTRERDVQNLFERSYERFGGVDILVANAGIWLDEDIPIHKMSLDQWNRTITTDETSVFLCCREFFRLLKRTEPKNASLVIVGSTAAIFGEEGHVDYAAAKAAITYGFTLSLKNEIVRIVPSGRVNAVCPGWTITRMTEKSIHDEDLVKKALQTGAIKKIARPEDIATTIVFLSSDKLAGHISGQIVTVAGGMEGRVLHFPEEIDITRI